MKITIRNFLHSGILLNDRGQPLQETPLLLDAVEAYEGDFHSRVIISPRRNGKSSAVALISAYELLCVPGAFVIWVSGSGDQASDILEQKLRRPLSMNSKLSGLKLQMSRDRIVNPEIGSVVQVVPASEVSAPGRTATAIIFDESRAIDETAVEVLRPSAAGGRIFVIGSPGAPSGWFYRAATEPGPRDFVRHYREMINRTVSETFVAEERARLERRGAWGSLMAAREWGGEWVELSENPLLSPADVRACAVDEVEPFDAQHDRCFISADLSIKRDLTSIVCIAMRRDRSARVLEAVVMDPKDYGGEIPLELVEKRLELMWRKYGAQRIVIDQYQGALLAQRLKERRAPIEAIAVTAAVNVEAFTLLSEFISERRLRWKKHDRLESELTNLELKETSNSFRIVDRDKRLHRDISFSLALSLKTAHGSGAWFKRSVYGGRRGKRAESLVGYEPPRETPEQRAAKQLRKAERNYAHELERASGRSAGVRT